MITIQTKRLLLRPITKGDADDIYEYASDPSVGPSAGWRPHNAKRETIKIMKKIFIGSDDTWGIDLNGKIIGTVSLMPDRRRNNLKARMLGYAIGNPYWGYGYMTEAARALITHGFEALWLDIITAYCYPANKRSKRVIEKCGMKFEGTLRHAEKLYNGKIEDNLCFSITNAEYRELKPLWQAQ